MKLQFYKPIFLLSISILLSSCAFLGGRESQASPSASPVETSCPGVDQPASQTALATPYAQQPAAGICAGPIEGEIATVEIWPDIPDPRCIQVIADQRLKVVNRTGEPIQIQLGSLVEELAPQEAYNLACPLDDYLAPGVHQLLVSPYPGPEIWLK